MEAITEESKRLEMEPAGTEWEEEWFIKILRWGQREKEGSRERTYRESKERAVIISAADQ